MHRGRNDYQTSDVDAVSKVGRTDVATAVMYVDMREIRQRRVEIFEGVVSKATMTCMLLRGWQILWSYCIENDETKVDGIRNRCGYEMVVGTKTIITAASLVKEK